MNFDMRGIATVGDFWEGNSISLTGEMGHNPPSNILQPLKVKEKAPSLFANPGRPSLPSMKKGKFPFLKMLGPFLKQLIFWRRTPSLSLGDNFPGLVYGKRDPLYTLKNQKGETFSLGALFTYIGAAIWGAGSTGVMIGGAYISFSAIGYGLILGTWLLVSMSSKTKKPSAMVSNGLLICRRGEL